MDLRQMNVDPREALAMGALASDLLQPQRVEDLEAFLARYPHVAQYIEQYLGFGYASIPTEVMGGLSATAQMPSVETANARLPDVPQVPEDLLTSFMEAANAKGDNQPKPGPDAELL
jgi:hypothetical protein